RAPGPGAQNLPAQPSTPLPGAKETAGPPEHLASWRQPSLKVHTKSHPKRAVPSKAGTPSAAPMALGPYPSSVAATVSPIVPPTRRRPVKMPVPMASPYGFPRQPLRPLPQRHASSGGAEGTWDRGAKGDTKREAEWAEASEEGVDEGDEGDGVEG